MGRSSRSNSQGALSLLSFQDIITSLSGIMILLVLLLVLDISPEQSASPPPLADEPLKAGIEIIRGRFDELDPNNIYDMAKIKTDLKKIHNEQLLKKKHQIIDIEAINKKIKAEKDKIKKQDKKIEELKEILLALEQEKPNADDNNDIGTIYRSESRKYNPWLVECSSKFIRAGFCNSKKAPKIYSANASGKKNFIKFLGQLTSKAYVVFFIKPSAADYAIDIINTALGMGLEVGYGPMIENDYVGNFGKTGDA